MWQEKNSWKYSMHNADVSSTLEGFKSTISYSRVATICNFERPSLLVLKAYETDLQFLQLSQNLTTYSLLIYMFCTNCKCDIVFVLICGNGRTILLLLLVQITEINKKRFIKFWHNWQNYWPLWYCLGHTQCSLFLPVWTFNFQN